MKNSGIGELLARAGEHAKQPLQRALRRASRRSLLWPEEAEDIKDGRRLTELPGIGPYLNRQIVQWLEHPPDLDEETPDIRRNFLTLAEAKVLRSSERAVP